MIGIWKKDCCGGGAATPTEEKTLRAVVWEAPVAPDGTVGTPVVDTLGLTAVGTQTPGTGANSLGNDYVITFSSLPADATAQVTVTGDVLDQGTAGTNDNAYTTQNITVSGNIVTYTLYSGDDGGGTDDARDRDNILRIFANCTVLTPTSET